MLQAGKNVRLADEAMVKVQVEQLYHSLVSPRPEVEAMIRQLRIVRNLDEKQYVAQKKQLPYIVCSVFNPAFRRTENFAYSEHFMLDIDHLAEKGLSIENVRTRIQGDSRVALCFLSPSRDGLKVLFNLKERCYDSGLYSLFYKQFARSFSEQHGLQQVIDARTSDVTRACFISIDTDAYYNEQADGVDINAYLHLDSPVELFELKHDIVRLEQKEKEELPEEPKKDPDPDSETIERIKALLNPKAVKPEKLVYVPEILNDIIDDLKTYIGQTGAIVKEIRNIQYGKKLNVYVGVKMAEINLFYGKRGFTVVKSPKCGTSEDMNDLVADLVQSFIDSYSS